MYMYAVLYHTYIAMIIHALDVQRASVLMTTLTSKKVENFDIEIDHKGSLVKKKRNNLTIVLFLLLDVSMSVAASVIVSLLLLSGDIEQNPGPTRGKDNKTSQATEKFKSW